MTDINTFIKEHNKSKDDIVRINELLAENATDVKQFGAKGDGTIDDVLAIQSALDSTVLANKTIFLSGSSYKITSPLNLNGKSLKGNGKGKTILKVYGCDAINVLSDYCHIEDITIVAYDISGVAYPRTNIGIHCKGTNLTHINYNAIKNVALIGFNTDIQWDYTWESVLENVNTLLSLISLKTFGQTVNNSISNSSLVVDNVIGSRVLSLEKDVAVMGEGLMITNTLIATGETGVYGEDFLALKISNCVVDLIGKHAFNLSDCEKLTVSNSWVYSQNDNFYFRNLSILKNVNASIQGNSLISVNAQNGNFIGANNQGIIFIGNTIDGKNSLMYLEVSSMGNSITNNNFIQQSKTGNSIYNNGTNNVICNNSGDSSIAILTNDSRERNIIENNMGGSGVCIGDWAFAPTTGTYKVGDYFRYNQVAIGTIMGKVCTVAGTPGTWENYGIVGVKQLPITDDSVATDIATLKADFNALIQKMRLAHLINY